MAVYSVGYSPPFPTGSSSFPFADEPEPIALIEAGRTGQAKNSFKAAGFVSLETSSLIESDKNLEMKAAQSTPALNRESSYLSAPSNPEKGRKRDETSLAADSTSKLEDETSFVSYVSADLTSLISGLLGDLALETSLGKLFLSLLPGSSLLQ